MTVYCSAELFGGQASLVADDTAELMVFAAALGLPDHGIEEVGTEYEAYALNESQWCAAMAAGAVPLQHSQMGRWLMQKAEMMQ